MTTPALKRSAGNAVKAGITSARIQELHRLAELGRLSATLLHEISNPLTAALLHLDGSKYSSRPGVKDARRSIKLLKQYVDAARQQLQHESTLTDFRLVSVMAQVKRVVVPLSRRAGVTLIFHPTPNCKVYGDPVKFQQILANLIVNAVEAYQSTEDNLLKPVEIDIHCDEHFLTLQVRDWGQGINYKDLRRVFEPFYTTKTQAGHGLGIGLAIVKQYVTNDFGGSISVSSSRRKGTIFKIVLPALYRPVQL